MSCKDIEFFGMWLNELKKVAMPLSVMLLTLNGCSGKEKDAFEIAKAHVWGDKVNGCAYQTMTFSDNMLIRNNSQEMIDKIRFFDKTIVVSKTEKLPLSMVKKNGERFTVFVNQQNTVLTFELSGDELQWYSTDEEGRALVNRNGKAFPTDFVVCG